MSFLVRPAILTRSTGCLVHQQPFRHFSIASRALLQAGKSPQSASTALASHAPESKDRRATPVQVVGAELPAAEGPHYQDQMTVMTDNELTHPSRIGAWTLFNPIYTQAEMNTVKIVHRPTQTVGDKVAHGAVKLLRRMFDLATGYKSIPIPDHLLKMDPLPVKELRKKGLLLSEKNWLLRIILLESVAGVPGMVGGTLRHLRSLRSLRRDGGWIHTLLEEAENERMHLLTFMTIAQPTAFTRALILAAQGTFYNAFFLTYLISPTFAHRFVGALEEEAVRTYTH
ncbi:MAG: Alternative oxidase, mitochondrial precursor, partial [Tremellales sp. Tagirdzhanova-0007]